MKISVAKTWTVGLLAASLAIPALAQSGSTPKVGVARVTSGGGPCRIVIDDGEVSSFGGSPQGYLGVELTPLTKELRAHFGVPENAGVMISRIEEGSPAVASGLRVGDIVTRIDDEDVRGASTLGQAVRRHRKGDVVAIEYWRDGKADRTSVTLDEKEGCAFDVGSLVDLRDLELPEIDLSDLKDKLRNLNELDFHFDQDALEGAMETLRETLESPDFRDELQRIKDLDLGDIEKRMDAIQDRLKELEEKLDEETKRLE